MNMAWSNVGNLKGPKGDAGSASGSTQLGVMVFAGDSTPAAKAMLASEEWFFSGKFSIYVNDSTHEIDFFPSSGATESKLCAFMKL